MQRLRRGHTVLRNYSERLPNEFQLTLAEALPANPRCSSLQSIQRLPLMLCVLQIVAERCRALQSAKLHWRVC